MARISYDELTFIGLRYLRKVVDAGAAGYLLPAPGNIYDGDFDEAVEALLALQADKLVIRGQGGWYATRAGAAALGGGDR